MSLVDLQWKLVILMLFQGFPRVYESCLFKKYNISRKEFEQNALSWSFNVCNPDICLATNKTSINIK